MLRPIPSFLLTDTMTLHVCMGLGTWQERDEETYTINNVHLQSTNEIRKAKDNTEVVLRSVLFIDGVRSFPSLDYDALADESEKAGGPMTCTVTNKAGQTLGPFTILTVDPVPDVPSTRTHHIELGLA